MAMNSVGGLFRVRLSRTPVESAHLIPGAGSLDFRPRANTHTHAHTHTHTHTHTHLLES